MRLTSFFCNSPVDEYVDVETLDHDPPLYFNSEKLNDQLDKSETAEYDAHWTEKVDKLVFIPACEWLKSCSTSVTVKFRRKEWNIIKIRMFKLAIQILEVDHLSRLAFKGQRDEAVKRHLMIRKTALRLKSLYASVAWDPPTCQWLHGVILDKSPSCIVKVYSDAFQVRALAI